MTKEQREFYLKVYLLYGNKFKWFKGELRKEYYDNHRKLKIRVMRDSNYVFVNMENNGELHCTFTEKFINEIGG